VKTTGPSRLSDDLAAAIPDRQRMLAVLRKAFEEGEEINPRFADALGDRDLALAALRIYLHRFRGGIYTWSEPWLLVHSGVRADPRFKELMREAGHGRLLAPERQVGRFLRTLGEDDFECH
jgi:hypothetical protein